MQHDHSWADALHGDERFLGDIFSLAFVRGIDPLDALKRAGGLPDTLAERTPDQIAELHDFDHGYPEVVSALALGEWTVLLQPNGFWMVHLVEALSRGTEALAVSRHDYATSSFGHAVDGTLVGGFDVNYPPVHYGADTGRLLELMREAGFDPDDEEDGPDDGVGRALSLAELITGVAPTFEQLVEPLPSMHFEHWFSRSRPSGSPSERTAEEIIAELDLTRTPGLADALAAARRGEHVVVTQESELGQHVREWLTLSRRASWSLNGPGRYRMTNEERQRGHRFGWLLQELAFAFRSDLA